MTPYRRLGLVGCYSAAGLNVNTPIMNGRLFGARRAEANFRLRAEEERMKELENFIARGVRIAWLNANAARQRLDLTKQFLDEATQALDLAQARYKLGLSSIVELSQAQLNQTQAEIEQASARYDNQTRISELDYQVGLLH